MNFSLNAQDKCEREKCWHLSDEVEEVEEDESLAMIKWKA